MLKRNVAWAILSLTSLVQSLARWEETIYGLSLRQSMIYNLLLEERDALQAMNNPVASYLAALDFRYAKVGY